MLKTIYDMYNNKLYHENVYENILPYKLSKSAVLRAMTIKVRTVLKAARTERGLKHETPRD